MIHTLAGEYVLVNEHDESFTVFASVNKAKFLFDSYAKLGFKSIKLIKEMHKDDFPKWGGVI
jgi:hypothetical protein